MANKSTAKSEKKEPKNTSVATQKKSASSPKKSDPAVKDCKVLTSEAMKYFFFTVEICRQQTLFHNGNASALSACFHLEERWRSYINSVLFQLSQEGWENVPDYIPSRIKKNQSNPEQK